MSKIGVITGYENSFYPQDFISRAEAAKIVSVYRIFDQRPTILSADGTSLECLEIEETPIDDSYIEEVDEIDNGYTGEVTTIGDVPPLATEENSGISVSWANANHSSMLNRSFAILAADNQNGSTPVYVNNLSNSTGSGTLLGGGKLSITAQEYIRSGSTAPDFEETSGDTFVRHYYKFDPNGGVGTTKTGAHSNTAYDWLNNHYYWAKCEYAVGDYEAAYKELGKAIHYLEDINAPHHANLVPGTDHWDYEAWVKNNFYSSYWEYGSAGGSYPYMCSSSFLAMSNAFSQYACSQYSKCNNFQTNADAAKTATANLTKKTQRAVAGLLYRFLVDTGRAN